MSIYEIGKRIGKALEIATYMDESPDINSVQLHLEVISELYDALTPRQIRQVDSPLEADLEALTKTITAQGAKGLVRVRRKLAELQAKVTE